jgi:hypothetical protein
LDGAGGSVKGGKEPVTGGVELATLEPRELAAHDRVMPLKQIAPR